MATYKIDLENGSSYQIETAEYPRTQKLKEGIERGLETGTQFATEQLKRSIPGLTPEISKSFVERPLETAETMAGAYGALKYPVSLVASRLAGKQFERPQVKEFLGKAQERMAEPTPLTATSLLTPTGPGQLLAREVAKRTTPEQFVGTAKTLAELGTFVGTQSLNLDEKARRFFMDIPKHFPTIMPKGYKIARTEEVANALEDFKTGFGEMKQEVLNTMSPKGALVRDLYIDAKGFEKDLKTLNLPKTIINRIKDPMYKVKFLPNGQFEPTITNMDNIRQALADMMTDKAWIESSGMAKDNIRKAFGMIGGYMRKVAPEVAGPLDAYHYFMQDIYDPATDKLYNVKGKIIEGALRRAVRPGAEEGIQKSLDELGKLWPRFNQITKDLNKWTERFGTKQFLKKYGLRTALTTGGLGLGAALGLRKLRE